MSVYKDSYRDTKGKTVLTPKYYINIYCNGRRHKLAAFEDKTASEDLGNLITKIMNQGNMGLTTDLQSQVERLPDSIKNSLAKFGIIGTREKKNKNLREHINDYHQDLLHKGNVQRYADQQKQKLIRVFTVANISNYADITPTLINKTIAGLDRIVNKKDAKGKLSPVVVYRISQRTKHHILRCCKSFCNWMVADGRAYQNMLDGVAQFEVKITNKRAAFTVEEVRQLIDNTEVAGVSFGLSGYQRAVLYRFAASTGYRVSEIDSFTVADISLKNKAAVLSGQFTKNGLDAVIPINQELIDYMMPLIKDKMPQVKLFQMPSLGNMARMIRKDITAADINMDGRSLDFHSLRHSFGSMLASSGVQPKEAMELMHYCPVISQIMTTVYKSSYFEHRSTPA